MEIVIGAISRVDAPVKKMDISENLLETMGIVVTLPT
jgi:hypothetical protein